MKVKTLLNSVIAGVAAASMLITPVYAVESQARQVTFDTYGTMTISEDTIDPAAKGSITLYKLMENDGNTNEANGLLNPNEQRRTVPNIEFSRVKIAELVNVGGTIDGSGDAVGFYYQLTQAFNDEATALGVNTADYDTVIEVANEPVENTYFSSEQVEAILEAMKTSNNAVYGRDADNDTAQTWTDDTASSATGETAINAWVDTNGTPFAVTDLQGKTSADNLDLGLYLIAETGYVDMDGNIAKTVYRSREYSEDGTMTGLPDNIVRPTQQNLDAYAEGNVANPGSMPNQNQIASQYDKNYNDDLGYEADNDKTVKAAGDTSDSNNIDNVAAQGPVHTSTAGDTVYPDGSAVDASQYNSNVAQNGTENPYVIENPCSPFLVSVPMTNVSPLTETGENGKVYPAGSVWQYDITVYPKNTATTIFKRIVADDGTTLDQEQDYDIGQPFEQIIYADAPATMFNHHYQQFEIKDTMSNGMTLQKIKRVAFGPKLADPTTLDNFAGFYNMTLGQDFNIYTVDAAGAETLDADGIIPSGDSDDIRGFIIKLTPQGLAKISDIPLDGEDSVTYKNVAGNKQVIVVFDSVLNENAVIGAATNGGKLQFNVNAPTLTWRHENTATRSIEGNEVKVYTYELDLTKIGKDIEEMFDDTSDGETAGRMREDHEFDASKAAFTIMQNAKYDPTYDPAANPVAEDTAWATGVVTTTANKAQENADAYLTFTKDEDGKYHVYTPTDGPVKEIVRYTAEKTEGADGNAVYAATAAVANEKINGLPITVDAANGLTLYQIVQPAASAKDETKDASGNEGGLLVIKGLDSEVYTFTELSTSKFFNLLKSTFDVAIRAVEPKDGNLRPNTGDDLTAYGATVTTDTGETGLTHRRGIITMSVNNYKTITLHTGGAGTTAIYIGAAGALVVAILAFLRNKKREEE